MFEPTREEVAASIKEARMNWRNGSDPDFDAHLADAVMSLLERPG